MGTVTGVDMNRDGIPDVLQQRQVGYGVPLQYGSPRNHGSTMTVTGVDMNRDGTPDVLQQPQVGYGAPLQYGAQHAPLFFLVTSLPRSPRRWARAAEGLQGVLQ